MRILNVFLAGVSLVLSLSCGAQGGAVAPFTKVIVSPFIQVEFVKGATESVAINSILVDSGKLHVEVHHGTLRLYLEGAKEIPKDQKDGNQSYPLYPRHAVVATVTYRSLEELSLRGDETELVSSPVVTDKFTLSIYGESRVIFTEMRVREMSAHIYGESRLEVRSGTIDRQRYVCYGEGKVMMTAARGKKSRITAYGEAEFNLNVSDRIAITSFGEAKLRYMGNPEIVKGLHFGGVDVKRLD
ncbi:MAG: DUF2807 domain-containing protein [Bacteroidetes bacterium]|nr:DUF2807 domain-containing protein [Bacteroidota bacterium]